MVEIVAAVVGVIAGGALMHLQGRGQQAQLLILQVERLKISNERLCEDLQQLANQLEAIRRHDDERIDALAERIAALETAIS